MPHLLSIPVRRHKHRIRPLGQELDMLVPARMPANLDSTERPIRVRVLSLQDRGRVEAVDE